MTKKELVTRLVMVNQTINKFHNVCVELTGFYNYEYGLCGEFDQATRLLFDLVLEGVDLDCREGDEKMNEFYEIIWGDASVEEKTEALMKMGIQHYV